MTEVNGWETYSRLVLQQLDTLTSNIELLRAELQDVKGQLTELKVREECMQEIKSWKEKIDDVVSPSQLKIILSDVLVLKEFKTRAITIFAVVQFFMVTAMAILKLI